MNIHSWINRIRKGIVLLTSGGERRMNYLLYLIERESREFWLILHLLDHNFLAQVGVQPADISISNAITPATMRRDRHFAETVYRSISALVEISVHVARITSVDEDIAKRWRQLQKDIVAYNTVVSKLRSGGAIKLVLLPLMPSLEK